MFTKWIQRFLPTRAASASDERQTQSGVVDPLRDVPRYPPFMQGIPGKGVGVDYLLNDQTELVNRIRQTVGCDDDTWAKYQAVMRAYAAFVHLLPASERHHHRGYGGLLRHGLEVGSFAMELARGIIIAPDEIPERRKLIEPRWTLGLFVAALCHDIGKPVSDLEVTSDDGKSWNPMRHSMSEWIEAESVARYYLRWRDERHKKHEALAGLLVDRVLPAEIRDWIAEAGPDILLRVMESLGSHPGIDNDMPRLVQQSDRASVEADLARQPYGSIQDTGVPMEGYLLDAMRGLCKSDKHWQPNRQGSRLWHIDGNLYVVWPKGGQDIVRHLKNKGIKGIPNDPETIADILVERQMVITPDSEGGRGYYWRILPEMLQKNDVQVALTSLRLSRLELLFDVPPPQVIGDIRSAVSPEHKQTESGTNKADTDTPSQDAGGTKDQSTAATSDLHHAGETSGNDTNQTNEAQKDASDSPADLAENSEPHAPEATSQSGGSPSGESVGKSSGIDPKAASNWLNEQGMAGTVLNYYALDAGAGSKQEGRDFTWIGHQLALRYPHSVKGYGIEPPEWLKECADLDWLIRDRYQPMKKVFDVDFGKEKARAVILEGDAVQRFRAVLDHARKQGGEASSPSKSADDKKAPTQEPEKTKRPDPTHKKPGVKSASTQKAPPDKRRTQKSPSSEDASAALWKALISEARKHPDQIQNIDGRKAIESRFIIQRIADARQMTRSKVTVTLMKNPSMKKRLFRHEKKEYIDVS